MSKKKKSSAKQFTYNYYKQKYVNTKMVTTRKVVNVPKRE